MKQLNKFKAFGLPFLIALIISSCSSDKSKEVVTQYPSFEVEKPVVQELVHYLEYPAYTEAQSSVSLVARVSGFLEEAGFQPGAYVEKGKILFVIEPQTYKDKLDQAEAEVQSSSARLRLAKESLKRVKEAARTNAVSEIDVIKAESILDQEEAAYKASFARADLARKDYEYCFIRAPFSGFISRSEFDKGDYINAAKGDILATVYDVSKVKVYFNIEDTKYVHLIMRNYDTKKKEELKVKVVLGDDDKKLLYEGFVDYMSPNVDISTGTFSMRAVVNNQNNALKSGMYVKVFLPYDKVNQAVLIHESAIGTDQTGRYVYLVDSNHVVRYQSLSLGALQDNNMREVTKGVGPNDLYISKAILKVRDGMTIEPRKAEN